MAKKHKAEAPKSSTVTAMTLEGVGDPLDLSTKGSERHYARLRGPGKRSKNPKRYDAQGKPNKAKAA